MTRARLFGFIPLLGLIPVAPAPAQCEPQRFWPDFEPRSLEFGVAVAISDEHLLVVDRFADKVYTYRRGDGGQWAFNHTVPGASGGAVSLDGHRFLTSSLGIAAWGGGIVYEYVEGRWVETGRIESFDDPRWRYWAYAATLDGDRSAVCNGNGGVLLFREFERGTWAHGEPMTVPSGVAGSGFGNAMAMDDRFFVVGAPGENITGDQNGAVYIYEWDADGVPQLVQKLEPEPADVGPRLGTSIVVDGDTLIVGARSHHVAGDSVGAAYVYQFDGAQWTLMQELLAPEPQRGAYFGWDVAIDGDVLTIGARGELGSARRGVAHLFRRDRDGQWHHAAAVENTQGGTDFAESVSLGGGQLAIGCSESSRMGFDQGFAEVHDLSCLVCPPDLDADGSLTIFDFLTFLNLFQDGDLQADFDGDGELTIFDFLAFQTAFDAGC